MRYIKFSLYQRLVVFLFFAKHEVYKWCYNILYQYGHEKLNNYLLGDLINCDSLILTLFILNMSGNLEDLPKTIN